eukprot:COSAG01_NODE_686_length_14245_cov_95.096140_11_plen_148_part_00
MQGHEAAEQDEPFEIQNVFWQRPLLSFDQTFVDRPVRRWTAHLKRRKGKVRDTHFAITSVITSVACEKTVCEHAHWGSLCVQQWHLQQGRWRVGNGRFNEPFKAWQVEDEPMLATESAPISTAPPPSPQVSQASGCRVYKCRNLILT